MHHSIMLLCIMLFLDRHDELARLVGLSSRKAGGLAVLVGRRRIGKTRILLEWAERCDGLYTVADESAPDVQRRYLARAISARFPDFADVEYPDWGALLSRLSVAAKASGWRGPVIVDEIPYLVASSPELPSVLQRWLDHDAKAARLVVAIAGSSQRMMHALVLSEAAPLFGRADEFLDVAPLEPRFLRDALGVAAGPDLVEAYAAWGGVPRYWELAATVPGGAIEQVEGLVLDPLGPLHREPERLLLEEAPSALEVRPVLDAIGAGVHRLSEIAERIGRPATSLSRPLARLVSLGLARRDVPFGESERASRRTLYRIDDPFFRLWFRVVAPHRAELASGTRASRRHLLDRHFPGLVAASWEDLCRRQVPRMRPATRLAARGPWGPCSRWWHGAAAEWDVVSESADGKRLLLGEAKWSRRAFDRAAVAAAAASLQARTQPALPSRYDRHEIVRALFVPETERGARAPAGVELVTTRDLL
jgi:AAA+ ATPase superfamily predicted ATPase